MWLTRGSSVLFGSALFVVLCVFVRVCVFVWPLEIVCFEGSVALCVCSADCTRPSVLLLFTMSVLIFVKWSLSLELPHTPYVVYPRSFVYVSSSHLLLPYLYFLHFELNLLARKSHACSEHLD